MTFGARLKEERIRLGISQTDFAALAGAKKGTQISWEKGASSPTATALAEFAKAGADVMYILTGRRLSSAKSLEEEMAGDWLDEIERDLLNPLRSHAYSVPAGQTEEQVIDLARRRLEGLLENDIPEGLPALRARAEALLNAATDAEQLTLLRAADFADGRKRREREIGILGAWFEGQEYQPDHSVMQLLAGLAVDHGAPARILAELCQEIWRDIEEQRLAEITINRAEGEG